MHCGWYQVFSNVINGGGYEAPKSVHFVLDAENSTVQRQDKTTPISIEKTYSEMKTVGSGRAVVTRCILNIVKVTLRFASAWRGPCFFTEKFWPIALLFGWLVDAVELFSVYTPLFLTLLRVDDRPVYRFVLLNRVLFFHSLLPSTRMCEVTVLRRSYFLLYLSATSVEIRCSVFMELLCVSSIYCVQPLSYGWTPCFKTWEHFPSVVATRR